MRRLIVAVLLAIFLPGFAFAQTDPADGATLLMFRSPPTIVFQVSPDPDPHPLFIMEPGACLRGALRFFNEQGRTILDLGPGETYPVGCEPPPKQKD